jgi:hypothetical protein
MANKGSQSYGKHLDWIDTYHGKIVPWQKSAQKAQVQTWDLEHSVKGMLEDRKRAGKPVPKPKSKPRRK